MNILALVTIAYGGKGGIARHNRHLLEALCAVDGVERVVALPRVVADEDVPFPPELDYRAQLGGGKRRYARGLARILGSRERFDLVVCGHLNLLPLGVLASKSRRTTLVLIAHGIEAWDPPDPLRRFLSRYVNKLVCVSEFTRSKVLSWARVDARDAVVIPNCIRLEDYGAGEKRGDLEREYGLVGKRVMLTVGRLSAHEQYKGHDEIMEAMTRLPDTLSDVVYLIVGDGDDRARLQEKARLLGLDSRVAFAGYVPDEEMLDHYRLADLFVMPGRGEGFGIVYLEALASGVPVIASSADASQEAVLGGLLGKVVDPGNEKALIDAIATQLTSPISISREALSTFDKASFNKRWNALCSNGGVSTIPAPAGREHWVSPVASARPASGI